MARWLFCRILPKVCRVCPGCNGYWWAGRWQPAHKCHYVIIFENFVTLQRGEVKAHVVPNNGIIPHKISELLQYVLQFSGVAHHLIGDAGELGDESGTGLPGFIKVDHLWSAVPGKRRLRSAGWRPWRDPVRWFRYQWRPFGAWRDYNMQTAREKTSPFWLLGRLIERVYFAGGPKRMTSQNLPGPTCISTSMVYFVPSKRVSSASSIPWVGLPSMRRRLLVV